MKETVELRISSRIIGKQKTVAIMSLEGFIDSTTAVILKEELGTLGRDVNRFILNFSGVEYVSSAGWGVILARIKEHREKGGDIVFTKMIKEVYSIYQLLELDKVIKYFANIEESLRFFGEAPGTPIPEAVRPTVKERPVAAPAKKTPAVHGRRKDLEEAIRAIIADNPLYNTAQIKNRLESDEYGFEKLGRLKMYNLLRSLNLNTREKRLYHAWQAEKKARKERL